MTRAGAGEAGTGTDDGNEGAAPRPSGTRLAEGTLWINECFTLASGEHMHVSVYLVEAPDGHVVVDSGSFHHRERIASRLREATGGRGVSAVILSHSDYPHSGNIDAFRREWGDIDIVASSGAPDIQGLPYARRSRLGGTLEVAGRTFEFVDPPLADRSHTSWIHDRATGGLYTADGFGCHHSPGQCGWTAADFPGGIGTEALYRYHRYALSWLRYVDPARLRSAVDEVFDRRDVAFVAPIHGSPIPATELPTYLGRFADAVRRIAAEYEPR